MTFFGIIGLMAGSLFSIYNHSGFALNVQGYIALAAFAAGFAVAYIFGSEKLKAAIEAKKSSAGSHSENQ